MSTRTPPLHVPEIGGRVRLSVGEFGYADGATLQEAADELVRRLLVIASVPAAKHRWRKPHAQAAEPAPPRAP